MFMADGPRLAKTGFLVPQAPRYQDFSGPLHDDWIHSDQADTITNRSRAHQPHVAQRLDGKESFRCESLAGAAEAAGARMVAGDLGGIWRLPSRGLRAASKIPKLVNLRARVKLP